MDEVTRKYAATTLASLVAPSTSPGPELCAEEAAKLRDQAAKVWAETPAEVQATLRKQYEQRTRKQVLEMAQPPLKLGATYRITSTSHTETVTGISNSTVTVDPSYNPEHRVYGREEFEGLLRCGARTILQIETSDSDELDAVWKATGSGIRGLVSLEEVVRTLREDRDALADECDRLRATLVALKTHIVEGLKSAEAGMRKEEPRE